MELLCVLYHSKRKCALLIIIDSLHFILQRKAKIAFSDHETARAELLAGDDMGHSEDQVCVISYQND